MRHFFLLITCFVLLAICTNSRVKSNLRGVIWSDCEGYYVYNPAIFNLGSVHAIQEGSMNVRKNERGEVVVKYTAGVAYFQLPFFLAARWYCDTHGYERSDIFNRHYSRAIALSGTFACFLGLLFLFWALRNLGFAPRVRWLTLAIVFGGTNLFHYATKEVGMSHVYSFCLFAALIWLLPRFYQKNTWVNALFLGVLCGWIALVRPTNVVALLIVPFYGIGSWAALRERLTFAKMNIVLLLLALVAAFVMIFPQLLYWKEMTGSWVTNSYGGSNEDFRFWNRPKILEVLFDVQNGLFLYSPLVLLMILGMFTNWRRDTLSPKTLLLIFVVLTYVFASWWAWWFGGAFGHRSYVELYALFALPTAGIVEQIYRLRARWARFVSIGVIVILIFYSVRMSLLYAKLPGPWDGADWRWNFEKIKWVWSHLFDFNYF